jgi:hypothetical protein
VADAIERVVDVVGERRALEDRAARDVRMLGVNAAVEDGHDDTGAGAAVERRVVKMI